MSIGLDFDADPLPFFPEEQPLELPGDFPELSGKSFLVTGSGCRLRDIATLPRASVGLVKVQPNGRAARLFTDPACGFTRLTSEWQSHLVLHQRTFSDPSRHFSAVVHAQPMHITFLTHIKQYQDGKRLCDAVLRWQPELTVVFPRGFGYVRFAVPNSEELMQMTREVDPYMPLLVWEKHGAVAVSDQDIHRAYDYIEYVETGAHYEYMNLATTAPADGLLPSEILAIRQHFQLPGSPDDPSH